MRNTILATVGGLLVGTIAALSYSEFFGDGARLAALQEQLDEANASLAAAQKAHVTTARATSSEAETIDQLQASNAQLRQELAAKGDSGDGTSAAAVSPAMLADTLRSIMRSARGGPGAGRMLLLKTRLHLTPGQQEKIQAAMDADNKARRELLHQWFTQGKIDPAQAAAANTLEATLKTTLSGDQLAEYQKVQTEEKTARADTMATMQVNDAAPLLQLTDSQKDAVFNALYQSQASAPDPMTMMADPNALTSMASQAQATQAAMAKVLTPDQMTLYQQQLQTGGGGFGGPGGFGGFGGRRGGNGGGGNGGGGGATTAAVAVAPAAAAASTSSGTTTIVTAVTTDTSTPTGATTNAAAATTNAASTQ